MKEMSAFQSSVIWILLLGSVVLIIIPVYQLFSSKYYKRHRNRGLLDSILHFSAFLFGAIWCLRFAVGLYRYAIADENALSWWNEVFNSLIHALQTFSLDEDYTAYITDGRNMIMALKGTGSICRRLYEIYASALNAIAPFMAGSVLLDLLMSFFPKLRLTLACLSQKRVKYYFSELNDASLALAKSLTEREDQSAPILVFTDAYQDPGDDCQKERLNTAKNLGAISLKESLNTVKLSSKGERTFFLMDEKELSNIKELSELVAEDHAEVISGAEIYVFCEQDEYRELEKTIRTEVQTLFKSRNMKPPYILPVHRYRNLFCNLFAGLPLYQTLPEKKNNTDSLTVTIIGTGSIGTEAFLTTTWMGQLPDHQLNINIISQEEEASFRGRIQAISPEILEASEPDSEILRLYSFNEKRSDPYYRFCYFQKDISQDLDQLLEQKGAGDVPLYAADCFIVAAGSDEKNIEVASRLSQSSARKHITYHNTDKTMISYVVYDDTLTQIQNQKVWFAYGGSSDMPAIYMKTFGALSQVYSSKNIFMENFLEQIIKSNKTYNEMQRKEDRDDADNGERGVYSNLNRDPYSLWSSNARAAYIFTKMYAFGFAKKTIWDFQEHLEEYSEYLNQCKNNYAKQVEEDTIPETTRHRIAWLEHRRWNAGLRSQGFRCPENIEGFIHDFHSQKNLDLKLHACLVECDDLGTRFRMENDTKVKIPGAPDFNDRLDEVSDIFVQNGGYEFKQFDYSVKKQL